MGTELQEALTAANAGALIPKEIDALLFDLTRRYAPLLVALPSLQIGSNVYNFNTRTTRVPGGFVQDGGARPVGNSNYVQTPFTVKLLQAVGAVTGFSQEVTRAVIGDLQRQEIESAVTGLTWDIENAIMWGNSASTANGAWPQFDGLDTQVSQFTSGGSIPVNALDKSSSTTAGKATTFTLKHLNQIIDLVEQNAAAPVVGNDWMFVMSTTAASKVAELLTNQQRFLGNNPGVAIAPGLNVPSYRDVPILRSSFLGSRNLTMSSISSATTTTGGSLAAGTYKYYVAPVFARMGEAGVNATEVSQAVTGSTSIITLSFTPPTGFQTSAPQYYKVFRTAATGATKTETLLGYVDANFGLAATGITPLTTTSIVDTGSYLLPKHGSTAPTVTPTAYYGTNAGEKPRWPGGEDIYLISRNRDNIVRPYVRNIQPIALAPTVLQPDALPFALVADTCLAVRGPEFAARLRNVASSL